VVEKESLPQRLKPDSSSRWYGTIRGGRGKSCAAREGLPQALKRRLISNGMMARVELVPFPIFMLSVFLTFPFFLPGFLSFPIACLY